jgi:PST family polysaccharide transporter
MQLIQALTKIKIYSSLLGVGITLVLVYFYGIVGALISLVISQVVIFFIALYFVKKENLLNASILKFSYDKQKARLLFGFSLMSIVSIVLTQARQMYLRDYVITNISTEAAGYWQAVWKISEMYLMIVTTSLSVYYLPKLSSTKSNNLLTILIYLSRDLIINVLYTNEFNAIRDLFLFQLIGDFLKIAGWLISFLMVSKAMIKPFIITEIVFILTYLLFSVLLIPVYGLQGLTIAFAINYFLYLIFMIYYFRKILFQ